MSIHTPSGSELQIKGNYPRDEQDKSTYEGKISQG